MVNLADIKISIPKYPKLILKTLEDAGYEAYIVGGCVRDAILLKNPSDYDITTNAKPNDVKRLFKNTYDTGIKHGTVTVVFYEQNIPYSYEVTTYRIDGKYDDSRHPKDVVFVDNLKEDLLRRDFTINAMAYNDKKGLVDEFGGLVDLKKRIIRAVGNPKERFTEDALRLLRAIRFSAKLGFTIDDDTEEAISMIAPNLINVSKERIQVELTKTITSDNPKYIIKVFEHNLAEYICNEFKDITIGNFEPNLSIHLAYTCLLYNTDVCKAVRILKALKLDNNNINKVKLLLEAKGIYNIIKSYYNSRKWADEKVAIKVLINYLGYDLTYDFIHIISINESNTKVNSRIEKLVNEFKESKMPVFIKDLRIKGEDLISIGFNGIEVGVALNELLKIVHKNSNLNTKKLLQDIAKKAYNIYREASYGL